MKINTRPGKNADLKALAKALPKRVQNVQRAIGHSIAEHISKTVQSKIPTRGGWYSIYRNAITYRGTADATEWSVAGLAEIELSDPPATTTLVAFAGLDALGAALKPFNPWVIDLIPPVVGGYRDAVLARIANESSVDAERDRLAPLLPNVVDLLTSAGGRIGNDADPVIISGRTYADIAFMARRLEVGISGFPRVPHWGPAAGKAASNMEAWMGSPKITGDVTKAFSGVEIPAVNVMSKAEATNLAQLREATWA